MIAVIMCLVYCCLIAASLAPLPVESRCSVLLVRVTKLKPTLLGILGLCPKDF